MAPTVPHAAAALSAGPVAGLSGTSAFVLIAVVVVAVAAIAVTPLILDVRRATAWRQQLTDHLLDHAADDEEVRDFLRDLREPRGVRGLTRSIIAVLILALVGFALAVAMLSSGADAGDLRKTIVTALMTVLATVAGFYFGTLGAQNSAEDARRPQRAAPRPKTPAAGHGGTVTATATATTDAPGGTAEAPAGAGPAPAAGSGAAPAAAAPAAPPAQTDPAGPDPAS